MTQRSFVLSSLLLAGIVLSVPRAFAQFRPLPQAEHARRAVVVQGQLLDMVPEVEGRLKTTPDLVEVREATNIAMLMLEAGRKEEAERYLRLGFDRQNMQPGADWGSLPWNLGDQVIHDANAIDFGTQSLGPILLEFGDQLSPGLLTYLRPHAQASLAALERHKIEISYTNIFLMNSMNTMLIAEWLHDDAQAQRGYTQLRRWMDYTREAGIHEYDSPTYTAVALACLDMMYRFSGNPEVHAETAAALTFLWTDLANNYFAPAQRLVGAHSRDYYFLYGLGDMDANYFVEGLRDDSGFSRSPFEKVFLVDSAKSSLGFQLTQPILTVAPERILSQRWDLDPDKTRYTLLTPNFAFGTANGDYGPQDKLFAVDFKPANGKQLVTVSLVATPDDKPYGIDLERDKSGHPKPNHLKTHFASVQKDGLALAAMTLTPAEAKDGGPLYFDVLLPSLSAVSLGAAPVSLAAPFSTPVAKGGVVGVRAGDACFAVRAWTPAEPAASGEVLQADPAGLKLGVLRYTITEHATPGGLPARIAYVGLAEKCKGAGNSAAKRVATLHFDSATAGSTWTLSAQEGSSRLEVTYDLTTLKPTARRVDGVPFTTAPLQITTRGKADTRVVPLGGTAGTALAQ